MTYEFDRSELLIIFQHTDPCYLLQLSKEDPQMREILDSVELLRKLANNLGLPETDSLKRLCEFNEASNDQLIKYAIYNRDFRVIKSAYGKGITDPLDVIAFAIEEGDIEIVRYLLNQDNNMKFLDDAMSIISFVGMTIEMIEFLVDSGAILDKNVLKNATYGNNIEIVEYIIDKGIKPNLSVITTAVSNGNVEILKLLLKHYNGVTMFNRWLLNDAPLSDSVEMVKFLIDNGATNEGHALYEFIVNGQLEVVEYLLRTGARNRNYKSALKELAKSEYNENYDEISELLESYQ